MTRSGASFGLAVEDRGGMGPCPSVHLNIPGPQWRAISSHARPFDTSPVTGQSPTYFQLF